MRRDQGIGAISLHGEADIKGVLHDEVTSLCTMYCIVLLLGWVRVETVAALRP